MALEEAIKTAIDFETKVRDTYLDNVGSIADATGRSVFEVLGTEKQGHIDYLESRLAEWQNAGDGITVQARKRGTGQRGL